MARTISKKMADILQELELENVTYVTIQQIKELTEKYAIGSAPALVAHRLKEAGWLLATPQKGVWEFAPAAYAGSFSRNDPLTSVKSFLLANPETECFLCLQTAAWALGLADRNPEKAEVAFSVMPKKHISEKLHGYLYKPSIKPIEAKGVPCLSPESILVHMTSKPSIVRSWDGIMEWLADLVYDIDLNQLLFELAGRPNSVKQRTGYLLQNLFPDAANAIMETTPIHSKIRFGPREKALRNDERWMISDTILPISPKEMEKVK